MFGAMSDASTITNWTVLHKLDAAVAAKLKWAFVFGETGNEVLFATVEDEVYAFGYNENGCLGVGTDSAVLELQRVDALCGVTVVDIRSGFSHVIVVDKHGKCYSWGNNKDGQLGNGSMVNTNAPKVIHGLIGKRVSQLSCGFGHTLALTPSGEVYSWGFNNCGQVGNGDNINQLTPHKIREFEGQKVLSISCGRLHSLALTDSGEVYSWGSNANGKLGIGNYNNQNTVVRICLNEVYFSRIACGSDHSLMMSIDGDVYAFGFNNCGQLGNGNKNDQNIPVKVNVNDVKFTDIVSTFYCNLSIGVAKNGYCYIWGECDREMIIRPRETPLQSLHDVFAVYAKRKMSFKPLCFAEKECENRIVECMKKSFNDEKYSDLKFKVEGNYIYVHKAILKICCQHFETMLSEKWSEGDAEEIEIKHFSYGVYYAFLKYLYTDELEVKPIEAVELYDLANSYFEETLKQKCVDVIKNGICVENFCALYASAIKNNISDLESYCVEYAVNNLWDIVKSDSFAQMDSELCKKLFISAAQIVK